MTQEELAGRARLSVRAIGNLESGRVAAPRPRTVRLLADALALTGPDRDAFYQLAAEDEPARRTRGTSTVEARAHGESAIVGSATFASTSVVRATVAPAVAEPMPFESASARPAPVVPAQLPADLPTFAGRVEHLASLDALLGVGTSDAPAERASTAVVVMVSGTAGVGKPNTGK